MPSPGRDWSRGPLFAAIRALVVLAIVAAPASAYRPGGDPRDRAATPLSISAPVPAAPGEPRLRVLVCLDGVPFGMVQRLHDEEGLFASFHPPARLISPFPAITEVMLTEFFQVEEPPGYGLRYYDKESNILRGGITDLDAISVWFSVYDYLTPMLDRGIVYLWAPAADRDLDALERKLTSAETGVLLLHLDSTDALMHHEPAVVTERWLRRLDKMLARLPITGDSRVEIVFFSDHGNDRTRSRRVPLEAHLRRKGWRPASTLRGESGVAVLPTGLISTAYLYTHRPGDVANALRDMPGLDFSVYRDVDGVAEGSSGVRVTGAAGAALIERTADGVRWRYRMLTGDPLRLDTIVQTLSRSGRMDSEGWATDSIWFFATLDHDYPDVLHGAWGGATGHVQNVGDLILSLKDGWHCGSRILSTMLTFHGTHGSLTKASVTGFWMSNRRTLLDARAEDALDVLGWRGMVTAHAGRKGVRFRCGHDRMGER